MLQFVTDAASRRSVEDQIKEVLGAGGNWITIDPSGMSDDEVRSLVEKIMPACLEKQAFLLIKDKTELAKSTNVGGVVLSQDSDTPSHARMQLGAAAVIGVEVDSTQQIDRLIGLDVDYVVMPFKTLGIDGVKNLCQYMEQKEMELPRVAGYGVGYDDIAPLMEAGCNGVAMSSALADADDIAAETKKAIALLKVYEEKEKAKLGM
ncbi:MAG: thiamine phosphate synthase [Muribaculaceae bacterium]|nr:thiamine phosphate synthase [Muribaculaceae bacterium]MDE6553202.1 thiamine phosphate synthase [Muribaculaceae bacterium]